MDNILNNVIMVIPIINMVFPFDNMIAVSDREKFIYYLPGEKMRHESPVGNSLKQGEGLWEAVHTGRVYDNVIPKEIRGFPFRSISTPITNEKDCRTLPKPSLLLLRKSLLQAKNCLRMPRNCMMS